MIPYALSLVVGLAVGVTYGLLGVRSPAPPIIALLGLLGMLAGEAVVSYLRGHPGTLAQLFHTKSFVSARPQPGATDAAAPPSRAPGATAGTPAGGGPPA
jgi:XapX domain-containing protein